MTGTLAARGLIAPIIFLVASVLALGASASQSEGDPVVTLDVKKALQAWLPLPYQERENRAEGALLICDTGESFEARVVQREPAESDTCAAYPLLYVSREGSFPYADMVIEGVAHPANLIHVVPRPGGWFLFVEGNHDQSVMHEHKGVVFQIVRGADAKGTGLARRCSDQIQAWNEDDDALYSCIGDKLQARGAKLVKWTEEGSCFLDYSICR